MSENIVDIQSIKSSINKKIDVINTNKNKDKSKIKFNIKYVGEGNII